MTDTAHTPTRGPWHWVFDPDPQMKCWRIAPGILIAEGTDGTPGGDSIDRANAEFIVRAVNSHDAMLAALKAISRHIDSPAKFDKHINDLCDAAISAATPKEG